MKKEKENIVQKTLKSVAMVASESASWFFYEPEVPKKLLNKKNVKKDQQGGLSNVQIFGRKYFIYTY